VWHELPWSDTRAVSGHLTVVSCSSSGSSASPVLRWTGRRWNRRTSPRSARKRRKTPTRGTSRGGAAEDPERRSGRSRRPWLRRWWRTETQADGGGHMTARSERVRKTQNDFRDWGETERLNVSLRKKKWIFKKTWRSNTNYSCIWMCLCDSVTLHSGHMTSILFFLRRGPPLLLSWRVLHFFFYPWKDFFCIFLWEFFSALMWGQRSGMSYVPSEAHCDFGLYKNKLNWINTSCIMSNKRTQRSLNSTSPLDSNVNRRDFPLTSTNSYFVMTCS